MLILPQYFDERIKPPLGSQLDLGAPINQGLVGYWPMNEDGGTLVNDLSGNRKYGTSTAGWKPTPRGPALYVLSDATAIDMTTTLFYNFASQDISVRVQVFTPVAASDFYRGLVSRLWYSTIGWSIQTDFPTTQLRFQGFGAYTTTTAGCFPVNSYCDVIFTKSGSSVRVYVNGKDCTNVAGNHTGTDNVGTNANLYFGRASMASTTFWTGSILGGSIWNRALSGAEVRQLYLRPFAEIQRPRIKWWGALGGEAAPTYTGSGGGVATKATASATGTFTAPVYTGTGTPSAAKATAAATGTFTAPVYTGTGSPSVTKATASATGTFTAPVYTGTGSPSAAKATASATGTFTAPVYTGSGGGTAAKATASALGWFGAVVYSGSGGGTIRQPTASAAGLFLASGSMAAAAAWFMAKKRRS
jgi:hypothetical protein